MAYRPQFAMFTPPGFTDVSFVRPVTAAQDPTGGIPAGSFYNNYIVQMDNDADQIIRSLFWQGEQQGQGASTTINSVQIQLRDAYGNYLTDGYIPLWLYAYGAGVNPPDGGSGRAKVFEPELYCPKGSVLIFDFFNPAGTSNYPGYLELRGVKRMAGCA